MLADSDISGLGGGTEIVEESAELGIRTREP